MDAEQFRWRQQCQLLRYRVSPIAALRHIPLVTETLHEHGPCACNALRIPTRGGRFTRKAVARQRWNHQMKRVGRASAMRGRIGKWIDNLELLDDRARPTMRDDHRQRVLMF